jgi:asparagine synthase (glutamine-hydrolysing)
MRNQLLRDADWAGMAHSLEIRTPLVDIATLENLACVVPLLSAALGKRALAAAPARALPDEIVERSKTGFGVPSWYFATKDPGALALKKGVASRARALDVLKLDQPALPSSLASAP